MRAALLSETRAVAIHSRGARPAGHQNDLQQAARHGLADAASRLQPDVKVHAAAQQLHVAVPHEPADAIPPEQDALPRAAEPQFAQADAAFPLPLDVRTHAGLKRLRAAAPHELMDAIPPE